jgi:hypothetical protein
MLEVFIITIQFQQCDTVHQNTTQYSTTQDNTTHIQYNTFNTIQHIAINYSKCKVDVFSRRATYSLVT